MSNLAEKEGVWFVYDGECPMCTSAAHALRIKKDYGALHLINAREAANDPLVKEINQQGFYHGKDALKFMARYGDAGNVFTAVWPLHSRSADHADGERLCGRDCCG